MSNSKFYIGDEVEWTSQAGGNTTTKRGVVVQIIGIGQRPMRLASQTHLPNKIIQGAIRSHESYYIKVQGRGHYWPRVNQLRRVKVGEGSHAVS